MFSCLHISSFLGLLKSPDIITLRMPIGINLRSRLYVKLDHYVYLHQYLVGCTAHTLISALHVHFSTAPTNTQDEDEDEDER